ncbi:acyltransferase family protein [Mixta tenebrionis]|uniref:Acyltransferase family protein n=1 Tax=Mixta tenebrionis TaxID=2562439 RepID=A0A506VC62_9GAMM|nr:acyltransferase family protein [Mixta tenebrionis]TPW43049.1 acyltransferase family protein [Mixta tenebrionis]
MNNKKSEEIRWVNTLKGGCILLVVLYHVVLPGFEGTLKYLTAGSFPAHIWMAFNTVLSPLRMPAFFFVSGMLAARAINDKPWQAVFTSRVTNLFYLYILWGVIQWFSIYGISSEITHHRISSNINSSYAESPQEFVSLMLMAMSSSWYLYALGLFFLFAKLFRRQRLPLIITAVLLNYAAVEKIIPGWGPESLSQYFIYFIMGAFWSAQVIALSEWRKSNFLPWLGLGVLAGAHLLLGLEKNLFLCTLTILACIALCRTLNARFSMTWMNWIGKNTLQIYVLHRIFIEYFGMTAILFALDHQLFNSALFSLLWATAFPIGMVALCSLCSIAVWKLLNKGLGKSLFIYPRLLRMKFDV